MRKIYNIRLKDEPDARINAIKNFKVAFELPLISAKERVDKLLEDGILVTEGRFYDILSWDSVSWVEYKMQEIFDCELENDERPSNENIIEPSEDTKKALAWLETLSEEQKDWVKLIGDWEHPASCYVAVC